MTKPALTESFVMLPRSLVQSAAWRSQGINCRRLIDFLMIEHLSHGGKANGKLKAPRHHLHAFGIGQHQASPAIEEAEALGLIDCARAGMRVANTYTLTWLPLHDGTPPTHRWQEFANPELAPLPKPKNRNLAAKEQSALTVKQQSDGPNLTVKEQSDGPKNLTAKQQHLSRNSLPGSDNRGPGKRPPLRVVGQGGAA